MFITQSRKQKAGEIMRYKHLNITERELLLIHQTQGMSLCQIAKILGRHKSTISRELSLHWSPEQIGLKLEAYPIQISYKTIYRAIYAGMFRGREFQLHCNVTKALGVEFYFPPPQHPLERSTNENANGLLREYFS